MRWVLIALAACAPRVDVTPPPPPLRPTPEVDVPDAIPSDFAPKGYAVSLSLAEDKASFVAEMTIDGEITKPASILWLHASGLEFAGAYAQQGANKVPLVTLSIQPLRELVAFQAGGPLERGAWQIHLNYSGYANNHEAFGLFQQQFGPDRYAYTQFEPMYARRVFPCIDEPHVKVPWQLTLDIGGDQTALGNTPIEREEPVGKRKRVTFAKTQPLPSYLVSFAVGPFDMVDAGKTKSGVALRIFTLKGHSADATAAAKWSVKLFDRVEDFIGIPYAYGKLDFVAVPRTDTTWVAMENPGLVTFDRDVLRYGWISTMTHEIAHQWFGNLVTPSTWRDVWMNEGFATWLADKLVAELGADAVELERPAYLWTFRPDEGWPDTVRAPVEATRTNVTMQPYFPGWRSSPVVARFEKYLGSGPFLDAVRAHLKKHAHGTARAEDLAGELGMAGPMLISAVERSQLQPPMLYATVTCDASAGKIALELFEKDVLVPVCIAYEEYGARKDACVVMGGPKNITVMSCPKWVIGTPRTEAFYEMPRMTTPAKLFELAWPMLTAEEQQSVLVNAERETSLALRVAGELLKSTDATSIDDAARVLLTILGKTPDKLRPELDTQIRAQIGARARTALADPAKLLAQKSVIELAALAGDTEIQKIAIERTGDPERLPPELQFLTAIAVRADRTSAKHAFAAAATTTDNGLRAALVDALAGSPFILELLETDPHATQLLSATRLVLMQGGCTQAAIAGITRLPFSETKLAIGKVLDCIDLRARMQPDFEAWLAPRPKPRRDKASR